MANRIKKLKRSSAHREKIKQPQRLPGKKLHNTLQQALALHRSGRLPEAERLYRQVLQAEPENPEALHFLGLLAHEAGKSAIGAELMRRALALKPDYAEASYNLGNVLMVLGQLDEAAGAYRKTISLQPDHPEAYNNLGVALKESEKPEAAAACCRRALAIKPDYVEAYNNLGLVLDDLGNLDEAAAAYRKAISLQPDFVMAYYNLGNTLMDLGKPEEAADNFRQAIVLKPDLVDAHYNLGLVLKEQGKAAEAVVSYRQALSLNPDLAEAHNNLGVIYREEGRMADAAACFRKALSLKTGFAGAYKNLTTIVKFTEADEDIRAMETLYHKKEKISEEDRWVIGFALGKAYEDLRDYDRAFDYILEANQLKRKSYEYSIQRDRDLFASIKRIFSPDFFASRRNPGFSDKTPFFIVGMPRSGTTLVEQILASHPLVFGAGELRILANVTKAVCLQETASAFPECMPKLSAEGLKSIGAEYIAKIREFSSEAKHITNKLPHNFLRVGLIRTVLPEARIIHCTRNPMDTCLSIFKNDFTAMHEYAYDMVELGQYYRLYQDLMTHWEEVLPGFMHTIRYEELISDQEKQTRALLGFCSLPWDDACLAFHKTKRTVSTASLAQVRKPIYRDSVELWKRYGKQLEPLRKTIFGPPVNG